MGPSGRLPVTTIVEVNESVVVVVHRLVVLVVFLHVSVVFVEVGLATTKEERQANRANVKCVDFMVQ